MATATAVTELVDRAARNAATLAGYHARCRHAECERVRRSIRKALRHQATPVQAPADGATDQDIEAFIDGLCAMNPFM
jgi:hypothetical protein